jgi:predicted nicotinamide N-methyase
MLELVETEVAVGDVRLSLLRPPDAEALIDETRFDVDEFLPYWAELWPSALALAEELLRRDLEGLRVIELGCGLGLPSLIAAARGAKVLATDWAEEAVELLRRNAERNEVRLEALVIDWRAPEPLLARGPFDLVLAADVLYERRYVDLLLELLPKLGGEILLADPGRPFTSSFLARWQVERLGKHVHRLLSSRAEGGRNTTA